jgi:hypothetical protein
VQIKGRRKSLAKAERLRSLPQEISDSWRLSVDIFGKTPRQQRVAPADN